MSMSSALVCFTLRSQPQSLCDAIHHLCGVNANWLQYVQNNIFLWNKYTAARTHIARYR